MRILKKKEIIICMGIRVSLLEVGILCRILNRDILGRGSESVSPALEMKQGYAGSTKPGTQQKLQHSWSIGTMGTWEFTGPETATPD